MNAPRSVAAPLAQVRGIYFDLDDTLCAYWDACKRGLREAFALHGPEGHDVESMVAHWASSFRKFGPTLKTTGWYPGYLQQGEPTRTEQMRLSLLEVGVDDPERAERLSAAYAGFRDSALSLFDETLEVIETLHARYPLGLITNGPADIQRQEIATLGIGKWFQHVYIEGEMGEGKPLPAVFERARATMGLEPEQMLFVGNSYGHDVRPALDAGWHAVWVRRPSDVPPSCHGVQAKPEERPDGAAEPDAVIGDLRELLPLLGVV